MEIRRVDVHDDKEFARAYEITRAADLFERPHAQIWSEHEAAVMFRVPESGETWNAYGAFDGEHMVGFGFLVLPLVDNTDKSWGKPYVEPELRRRGIGGAIVDHLVEESAKADRTTILLEACYSAEHADDHPYRRFAESKGFQLASTEIARLLDLPVDDGQLQEWIDDAAPHHGDYSIQSYVDDLPEQLQPSYCDVVNRLAVDAPTGDIEFEAEAMTPEMWKERRTKAIEQGRHLFFTVAVASAGNAVAATLLATSSDEPAKVSQWVTLVLHEHRGHRLGLAMKAHNLRMLQRHHPEAATLRTANEETNGPMVAINEKMGFRPVELVAEFQRKLA